MKKTIIIALILTFVTGTTLFAFGQKESTPPDYFTQEALTELQNGDTPYRLVDVRTPGEYAEGHIPGAENIPLSELPGAFQEPHKDKLILLYCRSGSRSGQAQSILKEEGYTNTVNMRGIMTWQGDTVTGSEPGSF